jgi:hypothetical protein
VDVGEARVAFSMDDLRNGINLDLSWTIAAVAHATPGVGYPWDPGVSYLGARRPFRRSISVGTHHRHARGQICGLKWPAVDLDAGTIVVHDNRVVVGGEARDKAGGKCPCEDSGMPTRWSRSSWTCEPFPRIKLAAMKS